MYVNEHIRTCMSVYMREREREGGDTVPHKLLI